METNLVGKSEKRKKRRETIHVFTGRGEEEGERRSISTFFLKLDDNTIKFPFYHRCTYEIWW